MGHPAKSRSLGQKMAFVMTNEVSQRLAGLVKTTPTPPKEGGTGHPAKSRSLGQNMAFVMTNEGHPAASPSAGMCLCRP